MYYTIINTIGRAVECSTKDSTITRVCGDVYPSKIQAPKGDLTRFAHHINPDNKDTVIFDGTVTINPEKFIEEVSEGDIAELALGAKIIELQKMIRPAKSTKKAERNATFEVLSKQFEDGDITADEYRELVRKCYA